MTFFPVSGKLFHILEDLILPHPLLLISEQQLLISHLKSLISDLPLLPVPIMSLLLQALEDVYIRHHVNPHFVLSKLRYKKETCFKMLMGTCDRDILKRV